MWENKIKEVIGYSDIFDFYDVQDILGKGGFGKVNLAIHKSK